jgi:hypothetical protein
MLRRSESSVRRGVIALVAFGAAALALAWGCTSFSGTNPGESESTDGGALEGGSGSDASGSTEGGRPIGDGSASTDGDSAPDAGAADASPTLPCPLANGLFSETFDKVFLPNMPFDGWDVDNFEGGTFNQDLTKSVSSPASLHASATASFQNWGAGAGISQDILVLSPKTAFPAAVRLTFDAYLDAATFATSHDFYAELGCSLLFTNTNANTSMDVVLARVAAGAFEVTLGDMGPTLFPSAPQSSGWYHVVMLISGTADPTGATISAMITPPSGPPKLDSTKTTTVLKDTNTLTIISGVSFTAMGASMVASPAETWVDNVLVESCQ